MRPMHPPIDSKLPRVGTTIFTVMSRLAAEHGAINLSQGFPDFDPPDRLLDLASHHMRKGGAGNQYAPMAGLPSSATTRSPPRSPSITVARSTPRTRSR